MPKRKKVMNMKIPEKPVLAFIVYTVTVDEFRKVKQDANDPAMKDVDQTEPMI